MRSNALFGEGLCVCEIHFFWFVINDPPFCWTYAAFSSFFVFSQPTSDLCESEQQECVPDFRTARSLRPVHCWVMQLIIAPTGASEPVDMMSSGRMQSGLSESFWRALSRKGAQPKEAPLGTSAPADTISLGRVQPVEKVAEAQTRKYTHYSNPQQYLHSPNRREPRRSLLVAIFGPTTAPLKPWELDANAGRWREPSYLIQAAMWPRRQRKRTLTWRPK